MTRPGTLFTTVERRNRVDNVRSCLAAATQAIPDDYYLLPIQGGDPAYRERTYCYELYHQMKAHWPPELRNAGYDLGGEVDKAGHRWFTHRTLRGKKPDLLVHDPGNMKKNLVIIEVKAVTAAGPQIRSDLQKLTAFCGRGKYSRGFYLVYGDKRLQFDRILRKSVELAGQDRSIDLSQIDLYWHARPGLAVQLVPWPPRANQLWRDKG